MITFFPTIASAKNFNDKRLRDGGQPVLIVRATHLASDRIAPTLSAPEAGSLEPILKLSIGCRLTILENIWTENGIVNGLQCQLYDISWAEGSNTKRDPPTVLLVALPARTCDGSALESFVSKGQPFAVAPIYRCERHFGRTGRVFLVRSSPLSSHTA